MKKLNRCLQTQKASFEEKETLLLNKNKNLAANLIELNEKLTASEQSIHNLKEQQDLMVISSDVHNNNNDSDKGSFSDAVVVMLKNEIKQLKNDLENAQKFTVIKIISLPLFYLLLFMEMHLIKACKSYSIQF